MGFFSKKALDCPICRAELPKSGPKLDHWEIHVRLIEHGEGAGSYTWTCFCGPADMYWPKEYNAAAGLGVHMQQRHAIPLP